MEMDDFIRYFSKVELCNLQTARIDDDDDAQMNWVTTIHEVNKEIDCLELYHERLIKFGPLTKKTEQNKTDNNYRDVNCRNPVFFTSNPHVIAHNYLESLILTGSITNH